MSIKYFPNRVFKKVPGAIDRVLARRGVQTIRGYQNTTSSALDVYVSANSEWQLDSLKFNFSNTASRSYAAHIASGIKVITDLNDSLWFQTSNSLWQKIVLSPGFYTGTTLATELQSKLNANTAFIALGRTFTVAYDADTGLFTITPASGTIKYIQTNNTQRLPERDSTGGHLFGLNVDTAFASNVTSDSTQYGLNTEAWVIEEANSTVTEHYNDDIHILSIDQALRLTSNAAPVNITYEVTYEEIV